MKKLFLVVVIVLAVFVAYNRERIYVRDPLGSVTRNAVPETGVQVYINYDNDVLLEQDDAPRYAVLVQHGLGVGTLRVLHCLHYLACMIGTDTVASMVVDGKAQIEAMSGKSVAFRDDAGRAAVVTLH